jgi:hypothetical protein
MRRHAANFWVMLLLSAGGVLSARADLLELLFPELLRLLSSGAGSRAVASAYDRHSTGSNT